MQSRKIENKSRIGTRGKTIPPINVEKVDSIIASELTRHISSINFSIKWHFIFHNLFGW